MVNLTTGIRYGPGYNYHCSMVTLGLELCAKIQLNHHLATPSSCSVTKILNSLSRDQQT